MTTVNHQTTDALAHHGQLDGSGRRFALVCSRFNDLIVTNLERGARGALAQHGASQEDIETVWVPGAWEIPQVAKALAGTNRFDAIVGLGAVIRGETYHFELVANHSAGGLASVALETGTVVTNGIITVENLEQAFHRAGSKAGNKGAEAAVAALETVATIAALTS
jgi:6,7-dimethyl-8-ribityllumazine synthase